MLTYSKQNFYFTSRWLWATLLISLLPWFVLLPGGSIDPHRDSSGFCFVFSGLVSLALLVYAWVRGERQVFFLFIVFVIAMYTAVLPLIDVIPPVSRTYGAMHMCKRRILRYAAKHDHLPPMLAETEEIEGYNNSTKDAWGRQLIYAIEENGDIQLTSLGKDNRLGGNENDADMTGTFSPRTASGSWVDEFSEWKQDPFARIKHRSDKDDIRQQTR